MDNKLKISKLKIENILGINDLEFDPVAGFNEIAGPNGSGKTSVLEAIKAATGSGHDATLLRKGAEAGEVVLVLSDDSTEIRKRVTADKSSTEVRRDGKKVTSPASAIKALTDALSVNPVDFLRAPKKDRVKVLLESMPLEANSEDLSEIAGSPVKIPEGTHALHAIQMVYQQIYDARTGTNGALREKKATINQLEEALPALPGNVTGDEQSMQAQIDAAKQARDTEIERIRVKLDGIKDASRNSIDAIKAEMQRKIDEARAEAEALIEAERVKLADIEGKAGIQRDRTIENFTKTTMPMNEALAAFRSNKDLAAKREQSIKIIEQMKDEAQGLEDESAAQTAALARLEAYKSDLLSSLPIPGLEVKDGEILRNGVHLDRLNTAQQVQIAVEVAKLRAGDLGVICVDGVELLDGESYEAFREQSVASGLQLFVAKVADGEFSVNNQ